MSKLLEQLEQEVANKLNYVRDNIAALRVAEKAKEDYPDLDIILFAHLTNCGIVVSIGPTVDELKQIGPLMRDLAKAGFRQTSKPTDSSYRVYCCGKINVNVHFTGTVCKYVPTGEEDYQPGYLNKKMKLVCARS